MILDSLILQTKLFLEGDMDLKIVNVNTTVLDAEQLQLKQHTSMIGVGGKLNLMVVISFDDQLLQDLVNLFMEGEEVDEEEKQEVQESVSGEVINTILGLSLPTFPNRGKGVTITPPITINDAASLKKHKNSKIETVVIQTNSGELTISAIGEKI
jgi:chemotaxis protein CheX